MADNHKVKLEQAQKYVDSIKDEVALSKYRQGYHFMAPASWINDPNGFIQYKGKYHLFYQYNPYDSKWASMHWGHAESEDLIKWNHLPIALAPSEFYDDDDDGGCFSGSAVDDNGVLILMYTGTTNNGEGTVQVQCIATSNDGVNFEKFEGNPVILPNFIEGNRDFRDPKVWKEGDLWYVVIGTTKNNEGRVLLYSSPDLREWEFVSVLAESHGELGSMWECPDFFPLADKRVLICSPQNMHAQKYEFHNGHNSIYIIGDAEKEISDFAWEKKRNLDYGLDFYAPQTTELPDGRRIMVAWMKSWDARVMTKGQKWQGMMTLPRELKIKDGKIWQSPVRELEKYKKNPIIYTEQKISGQMSLDGINGRVIDMTVELTNVEGREFKVDVAHNEEYTTTFTYYPEKHQIEIDRTYSGVNADVVCVRKIEIAEKHHAPKLHFIMDRYSVELFINDGEQTASVVIPTPLEANEIIFTSDEAATVNIEKYEITFN